MRFLKAEDSRYIADRKDREGGQYRQYRRGKDECGRKKVAGSRGKKVDGIRAKKIADSRKWKIADRIGKKPAASG
jgi:hypothetical protein